jgi:hypothetical protein
VEEKMNINSAFPSDYLKASDIPAGRRVTVAIQGVNIVKLGDDERPVVYFMGKTKGLVLNKTNANMIIEIAKSEETDNWVGVQIAIYSTKVDFQGRRVDALRVDYPGNGQRKAAPPPPPPPDEDPDNIPF